MSKAEAFKKHLKCGTIYRRSELKQRSKSIDRDISKLIKEGILQEVETGIYHQHLKHVSETENPNHIKQCKAISQTISFNLLIQSSVGTIMSLVSILLFSSKTN